MGVRVRPVDDVRAEELAQLTSELVRAKGVNPPGDVTEVAGVIREWLSERGFSPEVKEYERGKPNVIARAGSGRPTLILNGHTDVVPPGDESRWRYPPFSGKVVDGRVFGRGAADMKGGLAVLMAVFAELGPAVEREGSGSLVLAATADEEVGGGAGVKALVEDGALAGDAAIVAEPTGFDTICIGEKGLCQVRLVARGVPAHGSLPLLGDNAILKLIRAVGRAQEVVEELNRDLRPPDELRDALRDSARAYMEGARAPGLGEEDFTRAVGSISFNPGVIRGGSKINVVPDLAELELDMRLPPGSSPGQVIGRLREALSGLAEVEAIGTSEPNYTPLGEAIVRLVGEGVEALGARPRHIIMTGATDGRHLRARGVPTVIYGPGRLTVAHSYNEYVEVSDLANTYAVIRGAAARYLGLRLAP